MVFAVIDGNIISFCDPDGIRTHDPRLRRALLYPAELRDHFCIFMLRSVSSKAYSGFIKALQK